MSLLARRALRALQKRACNNQSINKASTVLRDKSWQGYFKASLLQDADKESIEAGDTSQPLPCFPTHNSNRSSTEPGSNSGQSSRVAVSRWRDTTSRIMHGRRLHRAINSDLDRHQPGEAPGVDPRRNKYQYLTAKWSLPVRITVVDYDAKDVIIWPQLRSAGALETFLARPREAGAAGSRVRWIHVDGLNWEVIQVLALKYDLHPLALEDTVHVPQRIKADFYDSCLYVSLIYLYLTTRGDSGGDEAISTPESSSFTVDATVAGGGGPSPTPSPTCSRRMPRTISSARRAEAEANPDEAYGGAAGAAALDMERGDIGSECSAGAKHTRRPSRSTNYALHHDPVTLPRLRDAAAVGGTSAGFTGAASRLITALSTAAGSQAHGGGGAATAAAGGGGSASAGGGSRESAPVRVSGQQVSLFLLRGGEAANTMISVFQSDGRAVIQPILEQLRESRTLVREAEDASFLANLVIDTLVDHIFPVVGAYREQLQCYEAAITGGGLPSAASTRELHAMQRDLRRIDRTIAPLQAMVANMVTRDAPALPTDLTSNPVPVSTATPPSPFLSRLTRTYLTDVRDHVATICEDLISLSAECGDLIGLIFNLTALQQSQSTQALAVVSTIFLPITFLAGVYGMNFDILPEKHWKYGYLYFWLMCLGIVVVFCLAMKRAGMWSW